MIQVKMACSDRRRAFTWWEVTIVLLLLLIGTTMVQPCVNGSKQNGLRARCQSNLKSIALAVRAYNQDYDGKFPDVGSDPDSGWAVQIQPYAKTWSIFQCPSTSSGPPNTTDYFYNRRLAEITFERLEAPATTLMLGDGMDNCSPKYSIGQFPKRWRQIENSVARRHLDRANYAFADGHVKNIDPSRIDSKIWQQTDASFGLN